MLITKFFLDRPKLTWIFTILIFAIGLVCLIKSPRQDNPNLSFNIVSVTSIYPGASSSDVETTVTDPLEDSLSAVDNIDEMHSVSIEGMSLITLKLDAEIKDISPILDDIRNAVEGTSSLPSGLKDRPLVKEWKSTDFAVVELAVTSTGKLGERELRKIVRSLEDDLKELTSVGTIDKVGYRKEEVQIRLNREKLANQSISFTEVVSQIAGNNIKLTGGTLLSKDSEKNVVTDSEFKNLEDVAQVILRSNKTGSGVKVADVGSVTRTFEKASRLVRANGNTSINLIIKRRGGADVISMSTEIDKIIDRYNDRYKASGIELVKVMDMSYYTRSLLSIVTNNAILGLILVVLALFAFLNFKTSLYVAFGIPFSILAAYIFFPFFDVNTNQITLITMIMVLGMIVDDAIVVAENINRHKEMGKSPKEAALDGTKEVFIPVLGTIATTIICFLPMLFMRGIMGKFIVTIPIVVTLTLIISLVEGVTTLPVHLASYGVRKETWQNRWVEWLRRHYRHILYKFLYHKVRTVVLIITSGMALLILLFSITRFDLFPTEDFDIFYVVMETKEGTSLDEMSKKVSEVEKFVSQIPTKYMSAYKTVIGEHRTDESEADPSLHENWGLIAVFLVPASKRDVRSEEIIQKLKEKTASLKGFTKLDVRELKDGPPVGRPLSVTLVSDDVSSLLDYEKKLLNYLAGIKGLRDIETSNTKGKEELVLKLDRAFMARASILPTDVATTLRVAFEGHVSTMVRREGEEIDYRVLLDDKFKERAEQILRLEVQSREGRLIELSKFASFVKGNSASKITHFKGKRSLTISADVNPEIISSGKINELVKEKFEKEIADKDGISMVLGGMEKETQKSMEDFFISFIFAFILIYFILVLVLDSFLQPLLIISVLPFGLIGVLLAFYLHGLPMSFIGLIGTLGMIGVVVNDSIVMVTFLNDMRKENQVVTPLHIANAASTRLRPVLLTTITTMLGLLPTVYGLGGTEPFITPMVMAMAYGLGFATVVTLVIVPVFYAQFVTKTKGEKYV